MAPHDELAHGGTQWVLANPGQSYIAYASSLSGSIGLKGMTAGTYKFVWLDTVDGDTVTQTDVSVSAGDRTWSTPGSIGDELAVWVTRTGGSGGNVAPTAAGQSVTVPHETPTATVSATPKRCRWEPIPTTWTPTTTE